MKKITAVILALVLLTASFPAFAGTENDAPVMGDTLFARPIGIASIGVGAALWVVAMPFALLSGSVPQVTETLISNPVKYTFGRPVGDFDYQPSVSPEEDQK